MEHDIRMTRLLDNVMAASGWLDFVHEQLDRPGTDYIDQDRIDAYERLAIELSEFARYVLVDPRRAQRDVILRALSAEMAAV